MMSRSSKNENVIVLESERTLHDLMQEYELPLSVRKKSWFGSFYFRAETVNNNMVNGTRYKNGLVYDQWSCPKSEWFFLYSPSTAIRKKSTPSIPTSKPAMTQTKSVKNPNNLSLDKSSYIKGETKLFVQKDAKLLPAVFERFETKNGREVIYVRCEGKEGFYSFPSTTYVFPNKDDGKQAVDKKNRMYQGNTESQKIIKAFNKLPLANTPSTEKITERQHEARAHEKVNKKLLQDQEIPLRQLADAKDAIASANDEFRNACIEARETGYRDAHTFISIDISSAAAERDAVAAQREHARIENIRLKPYFARVDCGQSIKELHTAYLGEREIPGYVVDWRHPDIGNAYYLSGVLQSKDDIVIALKRVIDIEMAKFRDYDDELNLYHSANFKESDKIVGSNTDDLLTKLLTISRTDKTAHDIIKTIQSEQYDIITSDFFQNAVINGCAGSGKTMIMYHRLSYIAYNHMMRTGKAFDPKSVYVISPSEYFDTSNSALLQKLSIDTIHHAPLHTHLENIVCRYCSKKSLFPALIPLYELGSDNSDNDNNEQATCDFYSWDTYNRFIEQVENVDTVPELSERYKQWILHIVYNLLVKHDFAIPKTDNVKELIASLMRLYQHKCFLKPSKAKKKDDNRNEDSEETDSKEQDFFAESEDAPVFYGKFCITGFSYDNILAALKELSPTGNTYRSRAQKVAANKSILMMCLSGNTKKQSNRQIAPIDGEFWRILDNPELFRKMSSLIIAEKLLRTLDPEDFSQDHYLLKCAFACQLMLPKQHLDNTYLYYLRALSQRYGAVLKEHSFIFIDEFQNYSDFELQCLKGAFAKPIFNLYGDFDQRIDEKGLELQSKLDELFSPQMYNINVNYRNARQITEYINKCVHKNMKSIGVTGSVNENKYRECDFIKKDRTAVIAKDVTLAKQLLTSRLGKVWLNVASEDKRIDSSKLTLLDVSESKGLEFDSVYVFSAGMSENEKYVSYTRALESLTVLTDADLEQLLDEDRRRAEEQRRKEAELRKAEERHLEEERLRREEQRRLEEECQRLEENRQKDQIHKLVEVLSRTRSWHIASFASTLNAIRDSMVCNEEHRKMDELLQCEAPDKLKKAHHPLETERWHLEEERRRLEAERRCLEAERHRLEEEQRLAEEQRRLEEDRRRLEEERRNIEEERHRLEEERRQVEEQRRLQEDRRRLEEERRNIEEERHRLEEERRQVEEQRRLKEDRRHLEEGRKESEYQQATLLLEKNDIDSVRRAIVILQSISDWKDASRLIKQANETLHRLAQNQLVRQRVMYRKQKVCQHCGGKFKGIFKKVCSQCGRNKDY